MYCCVVFTAAIGFPVIIMLLLPLRMVVVPRMSFTREELAILDGPAASPFVSYTRPRVNFVIGGRCLAIKNGIVDNLHRGVVTLASHLLVYSLPCF